MANTYKKFQQFLEKKSESGLPLGEKKKKPATEIVPDYPGGTPDKPPQGKGAKPYKTGKDNNQMTMKGEKDQEPLVNKGDKKNVYQPKDMNICPVDGKKVDSWPKAKDPKPKKKTKTEQFIDRTSGMSLSEFHDFMRKRLNVEKYIPPVTAVAKGKIFPDPIEATRYVVALAKANGAVMENLAHEIRRQRATKRVLANILDLPETYESLADVLNDPAKGSSRLRNLSRKLMEIVGNPVGFELPAHAATLGKKPGAMGDEDLGDDDQMGDEDLDEPEADQDDEFGDEDQDFGDEDDEDQFDDDEEEEFDDDDDDENQDSDEFDSEEEDFGDDEEPDEDGKRFPPRLG